MLHDTIHSCLHTEFSNSKSVSQFSVAFDVNENTAFYWYLKGDIKY